ncbi:HEAT repeat domain-containing protein [Pararhodospirillum photometricum]|nr:HEAT repeat domain-containing protein [Pararhodospirillum photometricum]
MGLVKGKPSPTGKRPAKGPRDLDALLLDLEDEDSGVRRAAVRALAHQEAANPVVAGALCDRLDEERSPSVRAVLFTALIRLASPEVAGRLAMLLRSDDAPLRNGAIEALQAMPEAVTPHLRRLLTDPDSDIRIFAVNILGALSLAEAPDLLAEVLTNDDHVNVCGAAVDALAEVGTPNHIEILEGVRVRFAGDGFMTFAIDTALRRIRGH